MSTLSQASAAPDGRPSGESRAGRVRRELRYIVYAWVFGALWLWILNGSTTTLFAKQLGMKDWAFGLMAALPAMAALIQLPASYFVERYGHRRQLFLWLTTIHRLMWVLLAAIPWVVPRGWGGQWALMLGVLFVAWGLGQASGPAWMSWMADVIPRQVRGRYFAMRARIGQLLGVMVTVAVGMWLNWAEGRELVAPGTMLRVTSILLAVAGVLGALDIQCFHAVRDDYPQRRIHNQPWTGSFKAALANRNFRWFLAFNFTTSLAVVCMGQYVMLFLLDHIGMKSMQANLLIIGLPLIMQLLAYPFWGKLMDRVGKKPVLIIAGTLIICGSLGWIFMGQDAAVHSDWAGLFRSAFHGDILPLVKAILGFDWSWRSRLGYVGILLTTFAWPGVELSNLNIMLDLAGGKDQRGGPAYVAINSVVANLGGTLSGLMATGVVLLLGKAYHLDLPFLGIVLSYHGVLFVLSAVIRVGAVVFACKLEEPKAVGTRQAIQQVTGHLYANTMAAVTLPSRLVGRAMRWSYKLRTPRPPFRRR